jgi:hypothetical protein
MVPRYTVHNEVVWDYTALEDRMEDNLAHNGEIAHALSFTGRG